MNGLPGPAGDAGPQGPAGPVPAQLQAAFPDSIAVGRRTSVLVLGIGTSFTSATTVSAGTGVTVHTVTAVNPTALKVELTAASTAMAGPRDVTVTTGTEVLTLRAGLSVIPGSSATLLSGSLAQGGLFVARVELSSGKQFSTTGVGDVDNARLTSPSLSLGQVRLVTPTTIDVFGLVLPTASTTAAPVLTITFDDMSTE